MSALDDTSKTFLHKFFQKFCFGLSQITWQKCCNIIGRSCHRPIIKYQLSMLTFVSVIQSRQIWTNFKGLSSLILLAKFGDPSFHACNSIGVQSFLDSMIQIAAPKSISGFYTITPGFLIAKRWPDLGMIELFIRKLHVHHFITPDVESCSRSPCDLQDLR